MFHKIPDLEYYLINLTKAIKHARSEVEDNKSKLSAYKCPELRIIASIDSIDIPKHFSEQLLDDLNVIFYQINTFEEFDKENVQLFTEFEGVQEICIEYILKSMTDSHVKLGKIPFTLFHSYPIPLCCSLFHNFTPTLFNSPSPFSQSHLSSPYPSHQSISSTSTVTSSILSHIPIYQLYQLYN